MSRIASPPPYSVVVFDCDSTLSSVEGIEELVAGDAEIQRLTAAAMEGRVPLEEVFGERLRLARPTAGALAAVATRYRETVAPHAHELVAALQHLGKRVTVVSGGLRPAVVDLASTLGIDAADVFAVDVHFDSGGEYEGFDEASPLARSGGKLEVVRALAEGGPTVLIGDGMTDLEARPVLARFIAFAAVEERPAVVGQADAIARDWDFAGLVPLLLSEDEIKALRADPAGRFQVLLGGQR